MPITAAEKRRRVLSLIKTIVNKPSTSSHELVQYVIGTWGVKERQAYHYLRDANEYFKSIADQDAQQEKGKILNQLDDLYEKALKVNQFAVCVGIIKQKIVILGFEKVAYDIKAEIKSDVTITDLKASWDKVSE